MLIARQFGFLTDFTTDISADGFAIRACCDTAEVRAYVDARCHADGWLYPPATPSSGGAVQDVPAAHYARISSPPLRMKPAHLWRPPWPTHLQECEEGADDAERLMASLVLHTLAFALGTRLQFSDWWFDTRVRMTRAPPFSCRSGELQRLLQTAFLTGQALTPERLRALVNILCVYARSSTYEWRWEQFSALYMCLDACWRLFNDLAIIKPPKNGKADIPHNKRFEFLCSELGIPDSPADRTAIIALRNPLAHEALWSGHTLTSDDGEGSRRVGQLREFVAVLIVRLLGVDCDFAKQAWSLAGQGQPSLGLSAAG
ncbi:MAG: hypothetical protein HY904_23670 [Deltaproteobacteria bacterium]|nr:hypothetical protein [Deltaproteobacteria bacterium]